MNSQELYNAIVEASKEGILSIDSFSIDDRADSDRELTITLKAPEEGWSRFTVDEERVLEALERIGRGMADILAEGGTKISYATFSYTHGVELWDKEPFFDEDSKIWHTTGEFGLSQNGVLMIDTYKLKDPVFSSDLVTNLVSLKKMKVCLE